MFSKILIANRGEIACRIMRTAHAMGIRTVAVYSDADTQAIHVAMADEAYRIGPAPVADSYLNAKAIIAAALESGAQAVHPGYGFLSENAGFVEAVEAAGLVFIGPPASAMRAMGLKDAAKALMEKSGVPVVPGYHGDDQDTHFLARKANEIGFPVLIKARAGGGGKGMRRVDRVEDFAAALEGAQREAQASFGDPRCLIEKYIVKPRHIEVQVFADTHGHVVHLFERDCSLQRRHQKVIEEAPAPGMSEEMRTAIGALAVRAAKAINYVGAGTIELIADVSDGLRADRFYFMEMNTRLQVEHPVTEMITGQDLVAWQLMVANGQKLPLMQSELSIQGWAFEARLYAEDAAKGFLPATGTLRHLAMPETIARVDTGVCEGDTITPFYDPMIAKIIVHGATRESALNKLTAALSDCHVAGTITNAEFLHALSRDEDFARGDVDTGLIARKQSELTTQATPSAVVRALAGLAALDLVWRRDGASPWDRLADWRLWRSAQKGVTLHYHGARIDMVIVAHGYGHFDVTDGESVLPLQIAPLDERSVRVVSDGYAFTAKLVPAGHALHVFMHGSNFVFEVADDLAGYDEGDAGGDKVVSPMPGLILRLNAQKGQQVSRGDVLAVIEAMKMEHSLTAPRDGVIEDVFASAGERVQDGTLLLALEPEDAKA